jgi:hypothetical protein
MKPGAEETALNEALARLERALLTPVIAGELEAWVQTVQDSAAALAEPLQQYVQTILHAQYAEIAKSDPEMLPRVQQLIATDKTLLEGYQQFLIKVADVARRAPAARKDENKVSPQLAEVEKEGTALILSIRKQQAAASTWLDEALYRDRGPVD